MAALVAPPRNAGVSARPAGSAGVVESLGQRVRANLIVTRHAQGLSQAETAAGASIGARPGGSRAARGHGLSRRPGDPAERGLGAQALEPAALELDLRPLRRPRAPESLARDPPRPAAAAHGQRLRDHPVRVGREGAHVRRALGRLRPRRRCGRRDGDRRADQTPEPARPAADRAVPPVLIAIMVLQANVPSLVFLRSQGYDPPEREIDVVSGAGTVALSLLGPNAVSVPLPIMPLVAGPECGTRSRRFRAAVTAGAA